MILLALKVGISKKEPCAEKYVFEYSADRSLDQGHPTLPQAITPGLPSL
jgi:hypothetical protein